MQFLNSWEGHTRRLSLCIENACRDCNNKLGLFVDASYAKSWFVTNGMTVAAGKLYRGLGDSPLPLVCIGKTTISGLVVPPDHVAEHWIGPSGETIVWVRYEDERTFWYSGGNPTDRKRKPSAAYLFLTSQDSTRWQMGIASFLDAFKSKKIRKILGTPVAGLASNSAWPGFDVADAQEITIDEKLFSLRLLMQVFGEEDKPSLPNQLKFLTTNMQEIFGNLSAYEPQYRHLNGE
jgi:hypothetical protein